MIFSHLNFAGGIEMKLEPYMKIAIQEAQASLCEGNNGFGAVIIKDGNIVASSHDQEDTGNDPTSHAEINAIRAASKQLGKKLPGCILVSTHEPCPMCSSAIVWAGITEVAYGYSIQEALSQGRNRIQIPCAEVFGRSGVDIGISGGILHTECSVLYREDVRREIEHLRKADDRTLSVLNDDSIRRRTKWFQENKSRFDFMSGDLLDSGYRLLLERFGITEKEAPVIRRSDREIVFHSLNFCPTLEACKILELDTRHVCRRLNESSTGALVKQIDSRLNFSRNYDKLRPYTEYCEEMISISENG
jgi:tRNA(adenine34) deaminase